MQLGFIGAGNMASALARGWGEPVLATDSGSGRAAALVKELGGEALASNRELERNQLLTSPVESDRNGVVRTWRIASTAGDGVPITLQRSTPTLCLVSLPQE